MARLRRASGVGAHRVRVSDVMHGPKLRHGRTRRKSYLIAFIDDATRVVPFSYTTPGDTIPEVGTLENTP